MVGKNSGKTREQRLVVGISGASGAAFGIRLLDACSELGIESHLVMSKPGEMTVLELVDKYLVSKQRRLSPLAYRSAKVVCERMVRCFGADRAVTSLTADDFEAMLNEAAVTMGPASLDDIVTRTKCVFLGYDWPGVKRWGEDLVKGKRNARPKR